MSFSSPKKTNPCKKFLEFKEGEWRYYDKELSENVIMPRPFHVVVLDQLSTIKGYSDEYNSGIYSNEVHSLSEPLHVRSFKGGLSIKGKYSEIKNQITSAGGRFCKSVYAMKVDNGNYELINIKMTGAALGAWLEFKFDANSHIVGFEDEVEKGKKGRVEYFIPVFKRYVLDKRFVEPAIEMDKQLQDFLKDYKAQQEESDIVMPGNAQPSEPISKTALYDDIPAPKVKDPEAFIPKDDDLPF